MNTYTRFLVAALPMVLAASIASAAVVTPRDTVIPVTMDSSISSATIQAGKPFYVHQDGSNGPGFPDKTKYTGRIVSVTKASGDTPGQIGVTFVSAKLPNGTKLPIRGRLISLDEGNTKTDQNTGRLMGTTSGGNRDLKFIAIGAGAGALIGQFTSKKPLKGTLIGAAAGYIYSRITAKAAVGKNVKVPAGTRFGIILDQSVRVPSAYQASVPKSTGASTQVACSACNL